MNDYIFDPSRPLHQLPVAEQHQRYVGWLVGEMSRQAENRKLRRQCEAAYDQEMMAAEKRAEMIARGQTPIHFDRITPQVDWMIGTERRMRIDFKVLPRDDLSEQARKVAEAKTKVLKWVDDTSYAGFHRSEAADDVFKAGMGHIEIYAKHEGSGRYIPAKTHVPWRMCVHDSLAQNKMMDGQRFFFRFKPVDTDYALAMFPDKKEQILKASIDSTNVSRMMTWMNLPGTVVDLETMLGRAVTEPGSAMPTDFFNCRQRVLLVECWSAEPFSQGGQYSLSDPVGMRIRMSVMTEMDMIFQAWSPYQHGRIPFITYWAYRNKETGMPYSPIRRHLDKQEGLNKAMTRAVHDISTDQLIVEKGAISKDSMTLEQVRDELDDPGGIAVVADGGLQKIKERRGIEKAEPHFMLADRLARDIDESSSVNRQTRGQGSDRTSGRALDLREAQTNVLTAELFDNLLLGHKLEGEMTLALCEQYVLEPRVIPVRGDRGQVGALGVNQWDGTQFQNDMAAYKSQFVIDEQPWRASLQQGQFESMMEVIKNLASVAPNVVLALLDVFFEFADIPNKQTVLERIRQVTGQPGPDNQRTPEQLAAQQRQAQLAATEFQAKLAELQGIIRKAGAENLKLESEVVLSKLESLALAAATAQQFAANPALAPVIDETLRSAGFVDLAPGLPALPSPAATGAPNGYQ